MYLFLFKLVAKSFLSINIIGEAFTPLAPTTYTNAYADDSY
jgi:hypothetical protein